MRIEKWGGDVKLAVEEELRESKHILSIPVPKRADINKKAHAAERGEANG